MVDVLTEIEIARPRDAVAAFAADPANATGWYKNIKSVEWVTPPPVAVGSRMRFVAQFLGEPSGFAKLSAPLMARAMRRANEADLRRLKQVLED